MMNKSLRASSEESSRERQYGFRAARTARRGRRRKAKKEPPETGGFES
jgi:hypothetical protein